MRRGLRLGLVLAGLAVLACMAGLDVLSSKPLDRITDANFQLIRGGMTRAEVEAILGPPGDYRTGLGETPVSFDGTEPPDWEADSADYSPSAVSWQPLLDKNGRRDSDRLSAGIWIGDSNEITIFSDDDSGRVVLNTHIRERRRAGSPFKDFVWRAKRHWHRWFP